MTMDMDMQTLVTVLVMLGAISGFIFALGKWAHRRENASARLRILEDWRSNLPGELDKIYARKDVMELRLASIESTSRDTNEKVSKIGDIMANLLVALAQRGDIERRQA